MSETSEVVEKPPEEPEPAGIEDGKLSEQDTVEFSKKDSDISMLEDEEMPTYSSISSSFKHHNSVSTLEQRMEDVPPERDHSPSPEPSEHQDNEDNESIYVVSSTADTDRNPDIEDEDEEDYDSEDINEDDDEEDEDDDDDEGVRDDYERERYERESDDFEADRFERASDDFVLRHNDSVKKNFKERSQSLQDLATVEVRYGRRRNSRFQWERNLPGFQRNPYSCQSSNSKPYQELERYEHVESKVKRYIQDIKEQNKHTKYEEYMKNKNRDFVKVEDTNKNRRKSSSSGKHIKDYAEEVIKELERDEFGEDTSTYATLKRMENGEEPMTLRLSSDRVSTDSNIPMEVDRSPTSRQNHEGKLGKVNGIIEFSEESEVTCTPILKGTVLNRINEQVNGAEPSRDLVNLRSLSYEEYMRGATQDEEDVEIESNDICLIPSEKPPYDVFTPELRNSSTTNSIQITNVRSNRRVLENDDMYKHKVQNSVKMINQATETIQVENYEVVMLRASLDERNTQFDCLQVAYQKTLAENFSMKQELENLKKTLREREENEIREKKSTAIQTEKSAETDTQKNITAEGKNNNKLSTNSITSALSSINQWSESGCSPMISIQSPDVRNARNFDDSSVFENTPKKPPRTFSRAFVTSSRILQTLSNITQGKWNVSSPVAQNQKNQEAQEDQAKNTEDSSILGTPSNSKKRKATEMLGAPPFEQPFKIPHTSGSGRKKLNQDSGNETSQTNGLPSENEDCKDKKNDEGHEENMKKGDLGDNLKYFIYQDEENSKDRSFLIQAEDPGNIPSKNIVRECGPYLLGNLEVRMTEVNGTINIWGKEINTESTGEEFEFSGKSAELKSGLCWKKTPAKNLLNNSYIVSSTNKKSKQQPRFSDPNISKLSYSTGHTIPECSPHVKERSCHRQSSLTTDDNFLCNSRSHRLSWSGCKHLIQEQKHGCCSHNLETNYDKCGCIHNIRRHECHPCNRVQECSRDIRRHSYSGGSDNISTSPCSCHLNHCLKTENGCKHQTGHCRSPHNEENTCHHFSKQCHVSKEFTHSCNAKHVAMDSECRENCSCSYCQSRNSTTQEDDPLIPSQQLTEPPEVRNRRLSGKKVRSLLMDLLKGCGDCRTPDPTNISKSSQRGRESTYMPTRTPEIVVTPCSPKPSCSNQSPSMEKNRCCDICARRIEMTAEIEAQLEFFGVEMERLRSRSDALLDKLNMLKSTDVN